MAKMLAEQVYDSKLAVVDPTPKNALVTYGEYTVEPMTTCDEVEVALLFTKICQRGNPVLQGRPFKDLETLGKAMYRKSAKLGMGQVTKHDGKVVGIGFCWDIAEGGVWQDTGFTMPASLAAHAACGKKAFESLLAQGRNKKTLFVAFYGMLPPHNAHCFGVMAMSHFAMGNALGYEDAFQYTLLPTLSGKGVFSDDKKNDDSLNWSMKFADVPADQADVQQELNELDGVINFQCTSTKYNLSDEYMKLASITIRMKDPAVLRRLMDETSANHLKFLRSFDFEWSQYVAPGTAQTTSKL